jgi:hypothetical protein
VPAVAGFRNPHFEHDPAGLSEVPQYVDAMVKGEVRGCRGPGGCCVFARMNAGVNIWPAGTLCSPSIASRLRRSEIGRWSEDVKSSDNRRCDKCILKGGKVRWRTA